MATFDEKSREDSSNHDPPNFEARSKQEQSRLELLEYLRDMARELRHLAEQAGSSRVAVLLETVAVEADHEVNGLKGE